MKNPLKKQAPEPTRRQRLRQDTPATRPSQSFSYHSRRSEQTSATGRQKGVSHVVLGAAQGLRSFWLKRFGMIILLVALVFFAFNIITLSSNAKIVPITEDTAALKDTSVYQKAASDLFAESFGSKTKMTVDGKKISAKMQDKFPELTSVSVALPLLAHRPIVFIQVAQPAILLSASTGSFVVGTSGTILAPASQVASSVRDALPVVTDQSGIPVDAHTQVLSSDDVAFMQTVAAQLKAKNVAVSGMTLPPTTGELDVQLEGQPYFAKFNLQSKTATEQAGTLLATLGQLQKQKAVPTKYIDVRVDGRAYYL